MSRSRRPNRARQNFVKAERDGWLRTVRDARATVETPEELAEEDGRYAAADAFFAIFGMVRVKG